MVDLLDQLTDYLYNNFDRGEDFDVEYYCDKAGYIIKLIDDFRFNEIMRKCSYSSSVSCAPLNGITLLQSPLYGCEHNFYELSLDEDGYSRRMCIYCKYTFVFNTNTQEYVK